VTKEQYRELTYWIGRYVYQLSPLQASEASQQAADWTPLEFDSPTKALDIQLGKSPEGEHVWRAVKRTYKEHK
jgi:hypothetical protein